MAGVANDQGPVAAQVPTPFTAYRFHRQLIRWVVMPVCGILTVFVALAIVLLDRQPVVMAIVLGPWLAVVSPAVYRRFVHSHLTVDEVGVTVVNTSTTYQIPWTAIENVELKLMQPGEVAMHARRNCRLAFTTPGKVIWAEAPVGRASPTGQMAALENRILEYRDHTRFPLQTQSPTRPNVGGHANSAGPEHPAAVVEVPSAVSRYLKRHSKTAKIVYIVSLVAGIAYFAVIIGVSVSSHISP